MNLLAMLMLIIATKKTLRSTSETSLEGFVEEYVDPIAENKKITINYFS